MNDLTPMKNCPGGAKKVKLAPGVEHLKSVEVETCHGVTASRYSITQRNH